MSRDGRIPQKHEWCSLCVAPEQYGQTKSPCEHHRGPDGKPCEYTGLDVYTPSTWVLEVVGKTYTYWVDGSLRRFKCTGYDPRNGFWMVREDKPEDKRNVSERAIDRTFHEVRSYA